MSYIPGICGNAAGLYQGFTDWIANSIKTAEETAESKKQNNLEQGKYTSGEDPQIEIDYENFYNEALELSEDFSFAQEGKTYNEQLETLAQEQIEAYDTIEADGKISFEEFGAKELEECNEGLEEDEWLSLEDESIKTLIETSFDLFDLNGDKSIDEGEIKSYYTALDLLDGKMDGNIKFSAYKAVNDNLTPDIADDGTYSDYDKLKTDNREKFKTMMSEIYNKNFASKEEIEDETPAAEEEPAKKPDTKKEEQDELLKANEPTELGKTVLMIENNILNGNFLNPQNQLEPLKALS